MIKDRITRRAFSKNAIAAAAALAFHGCRARAAELSEPADPLHPALCRRRRCGHHLALAAEKLGEKLGQRFVIENQPGPGGIAAARTVLTAAPDGYTVGLVTNGTSISVAIYNSLPFDPVKDFSTISTLGYFDLCSPAAAESQFKTLDDFIKAARAQPGKLNVGTINVGGTQNLGAELFKSSAGLNFQIIPYRGTPEILVALLRNDVQLMVDFYAPMKGMLVEKKIRGARHVRGRAAELYGRRADGRAGRRAGLRGDLVERHLRAAWDAAGHHQHLEQGDARNPCHPGSEDHVISISASRPRQARRRN